MILMGCCQEIGLWFIYEVVVEEVTWCVFEM